jgi:hypothetical protein
MSISKSTPKGWIKAFERRKAVTYKFNSESDYYDLFIRYRGFGKMPEEIKIEDSIRADYIKYNARLIARSRQKNKARILHTGLIQTQFERIFLGDYVEVNDNGVKKKSLIIFHFSTDTERMKLHFFQSFTIYPRQRKRFINSFVNHRIEEEKREAQRIKSFSLNNTMRK